MDQASPHARPQRDRGELGTRVGGRITLFVVVAMAVAGAVSWGAFRGGAQVSPATTVAGAPAGFGRHVEGRSKTADPAAKPAIKQRASRQKAHDWRRDLAAAQERHDDVRVLPSFSYGRQRAQALLDKKYRRFEAKVRRACPDRVFVDELLARASRANEQIAYAAAEAGHGLRTKAEQRELEFKITREMYDDVCKDLADARPASANCEHALPMCRDGEFVGHH